MAIHESTLKIVEAYEVAAENCGTPEHERSIIILAFLSIQMRSPSWRRPSAEAILDEMHRFNITC